MKHAGAQALDQIELILAALRRLEGLTEKSRGVFYLGRAAFLHFHEDPTGLFADVKIGASFVRFPVNSRAEALALLHRARRELGF
jgi:hypothetical protein